MTMTETWPNPQAPIHDEREDQQLAVLAETRDYTRRIHWWIRLFGVVWLTSVIVGAIVGAIALISLAVLGHNAANKLNDVDNSSSYSSRSTCMAAPETTLAQCNARFGND